MLCEYRRFSNVFQRNATVGKGSLGLPQGMVHVSMVASNTAGNFANPFAGFDVGCSWDIMVIYYGKQANFSCPLCKAVSL